jgi:hypothetical protein
LTFPEGVLCPVFAAGFDTQFPRPKFVLFSVQLLAKDFLTDSFVFCVALISPGDRFYRSAGGETLLLLQSGSLSSSPKVEFLLCCPVRYFKFSLLFVLADYCESL